MPSEQCSDKERDFMRVRYIAKLLQWKQAEPLKGSWGKTNLHLIVDLILFCMSNYSRKQWYFIFNK